MRILGIDPGVTGALALLDNGIDVLLVRDMPTLPGTKRKLVLSPIGVFELIEAFEPDVAFLERVHAMSKQGVTSSFNFGVSYGIVQGALGSCHVPYHFVTPQEWKHHFRMGADKNAARATASRLYPKHATTFSRRKDHGRAEAVLLAHYGLACVVSGLGRRINNKSIDNTKCGLP